MRPFLSVPSCFLNQGAWGGAVNAPRPGRPRNGQQGRGPQPGTWPVCDCGKILHPLCVSIGTGSGWHDALAAGGRAALRRGRCGPVPTPPHRPSQEPGITCTPGPLGSAWPQRCWDGKDARWGLRSQGTAQASVPSPGSDLPLALCGAQCAGQQERFRPLKASRGMEGLLGAGKINRSLGPSLRSNGGLQFVLWNLKIK